MDGTDPVKEVNERGKPPNSFVGTLTNPFSGVEKSGTYSADIILYLPLISSVKVKSSDGTSTVVGATAAIATTNAFHANTDVFEQLYEKIFNPTLNYQAAFRIGSIDVGSVYPNSGVFLDAETVDYTILSAVNTSTYTFQWLAGNANIHLVGFKKEGNPTIYSTLNLYPSADPTIKQKLEELSDPVYAKLVIFNDVNTTMTPVYNYYSEGSHLYQLLWGKKWQ
ncbi:MAG: hypothetical protein ACI4UJ_08670 [Candidatus Cryptobacteroides sp.]